MLSMEAGWRRISAEEDGLERLCAMVNDNLRLQVISSNIIMYRMFWVLGGKLGVVYAMPATSYFVFGRSGPNKGSADQSKSAQSEGRKIALALWRISLYGRASRLALESTPALAANQGYISGLFRRGYDTARAMCVLLLCFVLI